MQDHKKLITFLQESLENKATQKTKMWWEKYMKGVIAFRGVGIPEIRDLIATWLNEYSIKDLSKENQLELALAFFQEPIAEDKLAGILYLQYYLYDQFAWEVLLKKYEALYTNNLIFDWNTCDWFCVRVLSPTIAKHGVDCAEAISSWKDTENLWQARSSVVAFVKVASNKSYYLCIQESCHTLIQRQERFAKTSVGWVLRDISKHDEDFVKCFIESHIQWFSIESLRNAVKYWDKDEQNKYVKLLKAA
ncbi:DNA alkylation repair protein [Nostocales cyanobacterium LEGE 11386]|nr:DNA alkylation repair protein [Nostocales cyanobacterium LEGE 11386]